MDNQIKVALAGNPNSGKTTLFNALTGSNQYVGNWPGVTVERKEGKIKGAKGEDTILIQDLPGIYSLSPYTLEEVVARDYLVKDRPDAILNIVDATNIERNLYLTTQLSELGIPMVIALNMIDLTRKNGDMIDVKKLADALQCEVVETSALKGEGGMDAARRAAALKGKVRQGDSLHVFMGSVEHAIAHMEDIMAREKLDIPHHLTRWYAIKLFERDEKVMADLSLSDEAKKDIEETIKNCEAEMGDDAESIITNQRYAYINQIMTTCVKKARAKGAMTTSDKIDRVITNRWLALPIFALVMFLVYYVSVTTIGTIVTDFTNDVFVEEWIKNPAMEWMESIGTADWLVGLIGEGIIGGVGAVLGFVPQLLVLFFFLAILEDVGYMARVAFIMDRIFRKFGLSGKSFIPMLISSGCGVPGIMASRTIENDRDRKMTIMTTTFVPCGAKLPIIAIIAGALFHNAGWVAFSAYVIGVAAIVISGIILKKTKMFAGDPAPFVMELPAYHTPSWVNVLRSMWERGWSFIKRAGTVILLSSILIWFTSSYGFVSPEAVGAEAGDEGTPAVEMAADEAAGDAADAAGEADGAVKEAVGEEKPAEGLVFAKVEDSDQSMLGVAGSAVAPVFNPLGFGRWEPTVATVMGLVAKEEVVGVFGVLYQIDTDEMTAQDILDDEEMSDEEKEEKLRPVLASFRESSGGHPYMAAFAFLVFNLICAPCFAAIGAIKREMNNAKWTLFAVGYQTIFAYVLALMIYQIGILFTGGAFTLWTGVAFALLAVMCYLLFRKNKYTDQHLTQKI